MSTPREEEIRFLAKQLFVHGDESSAVVCWDNACNFLLVLDNMQAMRRKALETPHVPEPARAVHVGVTK